MEYLIGAVIVYYLLKGAVYLQERSHDKAFDRAMAQARDELRRERGE